MLRTADLPTADLSTPYDTPITEGLTVNITATTTHVDAHAFHPTSRGLVTRTRRDDVAAVPAAITSEWIKLRSLRSTWAILALTAVIGVVMSWVLATFVKTDPYDHLPFTVANSFSASTWLSTVLALVVGILMFTSEVQHGTISNAIAARPARWVTVAGKAVVAAGFGLAIGLFGMVASIGAGLASGMDMGDTTGMGVTIAWSLLLTSCAAIFGIGVGMIIRHSAAAVSAMLVWALVVENLIRSVAPANVSRFLPFSAANGLLNIRSAGDTTESLAARLSRPADALVFIAFTVTAMAVGTVLLYRRDAD